MHAIRLWMWLFSMKNDGFNDDTLSVILCRRASLYTVYVYISAALQCQRSRFQCHTPLVSVPALFLVHVSHEYWLLTIVLSEVVNSVILITVSLNLILRAVRFSIIYSLSRFYTIRKLICNDCHWRIQGGGGGYGGFNPPFKFQKLKRIIKQGKN